MPNNLYKIKSITLKKNQIYVITAKKDGLNYKILNFKDSKTIDISKFKVGKYYDLELENIHPGKNMMLNHGIRTVKYGKCKFRITAKYHYSLYKFKSDIYFLYYAL